MKSNVTLARAISVALLVGATSALAAGAGGGTMAGTTGAAHQAPAAAGTAPRAAPAPTAPTTTTTSTQGPAHVTGQPNKSCETAPGTPGNAASAPGSAFNPDGKSGTVYAGEQPQNSRNSASVSQYDVACANQR